VPLTREVAEAIYLGLIYDTGSFQYTLTTPETHRIAARLMETGMDFARIHERALLEQDFENLLLLGKVLSTAERRGEAREIVHAAIPRDLARSMQVKSEDYNKIIQTLCFIDGVEVAVLFRELDGAEWKLSLRSRGLVDVAAIARELDPQGGGHDRASGCTLPGPLEAAVARAVAHIDAKVRAVKAAQRGGGL
jgi:phosphoesterase RecJ-like protein